MVAFDWQPVSWCVLKPAGVIHDGLVVAGREFVLMRVLLSKEIVMSFVDERVCVQQQHQEPVMKRARKEGKKEGAREGKGGKERWKLIGQGDKGYKEKRGVHSNRGSLVCSF